jgi:hypothetical protein
LCIGVKLYGGVCHTYIWVHGKVTYHATTRRPDMW